MTRMTMVLMGMTTLLLSATSAVAQTQAPNANGGVVVIVPNGYDVTHTAVPTAPESTATASSVQLATPPPTQLTDPTGETPPDYQPPEVARTRANRALVIPGAVSLAVGYGANLIGSLLYSSLRAVAGVDNTDTFLAMSVIPVVGPWLQLPFASSDLEVGFLIGAGLLEAGGLTMLIAGLTFARRTVNEVQLSETTTIRVDPMIGSSAAGLTASGTF